MTDADLRHQLADMVSEATDGEVPAADVLAPGHSLNALGVTSLAVLRLADAIELRFGVELDLDAEVPPMRSLDTLAAAVEHAR